MEVAELAKELYELGIRRGLDDVNAAHRAGPILLRVIGNAVGGARAPQHADLVRFITQQVDHLEPDDRRIAFACFALYDRLGDAGVEAELRAAGHDGVARTDSLCSRCAMLTPLYDVAGRTLQRRFQDKICQTIAANVLARSPSHAEGPYHTEELDLSVKLDQDIREVIETRRIVSDKAELSVIDLALTVDSPIAPDSRGASLSGLDLEVIHGGLLTSRVEENAARIRFQLKLPRPLRWGQRHLYQIRMRSPENRPLLPFQVCTPDQPCDRFDLHIRFGSAGAPARIWRLDGAHPEQVRYDDGRLWENVDIDPCGEVHASFSRLRPRLSYGLGWRAAA